MDVFAKNFTNVIKMIILGSRCRKLKNRRRSFSPVLLTTEFLTFRRWTTLASIASSKASNRSRWLRGSSTTSSLTTLTSRIRWMRCRWHKTFFFSSSAIFWRSSKVRSRRVLSLFLSWPWNGCKALSGTNTPAYLVSLQVTKKKVLWYFGPRHQS